MPYQLTLRPDTGPLTLAETDRLLAELARMPRCPEVAEVTDTVLDYRHQFGKVITICYGCGGSRTDAKGGPSRRCNGSGVDPNP